MSEVVQKNPYETRLLEHIPEEIQQAAEIFLEEYGNSHELQQALVMETADALYALSKKNVPAEEKSMYARHILGMVSPFFEGDQREAKIQGIQGEVCARLSFEEMGFSVLAPKMEEDLHRGIDFFADPKDGTIWAIQVKTHRGLEEAAVEILGPEGHVSPLISRAQFEETLETTKLMYDYTLTNEIKLQHPEFGEREIIPVMVRLPAGGRGIDDVAVYKNTGEPVSGFPDRLYDKISRTMGWEGEK